VELVKEEGKRLKIEVELIKEEGKGLKREVVLVKKYLAQQCHTEVLTTLGVGYGTETAPEVLGWPTMPLTTTTGVLSSADKNKKRFRRVKQL